jgi:alcohol dehydrogenase
MRASCLFDESVPLNLMTEIDFQLRPRIVFGCGVIERLGTCALELGAQRVLVVTDRGVVAAGHFEAGRRSLLEAGLEVASFHEFGENPTSADVARGVAVCREFKPDFLVGLGGGSSMDCAKGMNFVFSCGGRIQDYWGVGKATGDLLPMIAVPTTAGTGSESQSFALISDSESHVKMACGDPRASCRIALLDPQLTVTQPALVTALTGVDALSHALETYVTRRRTVFSQAFSRQSFRLICESLPRILERPQDLEARGNMQLGACLAGMAIEASMLGAAHATANPLTAEYGIAHGQAVGVMLPHVIRFNGKHFPQGYLELLSDLEPTTARSVESAPEILAERVTQLIQAAGLKTRLADLGVAADRIPDLATAAMAQWTGTFNPVALDIESVKQLYQRAF